MLYYDNFPDEKIESRKLQKQMCLSCQIRQVHDVIKIILKSKHLNRIKNYHLALKKCCRSCPGDSARQLFLLWQAKDSG